MGKWGFYILQLRQILNIFGGPEVSIAFIITTIKSTEPCTIVIGFCLGQNVPYEQNQAGGFGFKKSTVPSQPRIVPNSGTMQHTTPDQHSGAMTQSRPGQHSSFVPQSRPLQPQSRPLQPQSRPLQPQSRPFPPQSRPLHQGGNMGQSRTPQQGGTVTQSRPGQSLHQRGIMPPARQVQVNGMMSDRRFVIYKVNTNYISVYSFIIEKRNLLSQSFIKETFFYLFLVQMCKINRFDYRGCRGLLVVISNINKQDEC